MKKIFSWIGIIAIILSLFPTSLLTEVSAKENYSYTLEGLVYNGTPSSSGSWTSGNLCQGGGGCYTEGDNVPSRITVSGLTSGQHYSVIVQHDYQDSDLRVGYDNFNRSSIVLPDDGASSVTVTLDSIVNDKGSTLKNYQLGFEAAAETAVIYWNSQLGIDAADWSGSSLHFRLVSGAAGESIGNKEIPIMVNQLMFLPSLTITKSVDSGNASPDQ